MLEAEDGLDQQEVGQGVAYTLIREASHRMQSSYGEARAAARPRLPIQLREPLPQNLPHEHRAVAVRLEVDADVEGLGRVVHVLDARLREGDLDTLFC